MNSFDSTAVIYARFSSHNQREESIEAQERACREYAQRKGLQVIEVYADRAKSGTNAEREEFQRMIKDSGDKKFRYLIVHKLDRFSRDKYDAVTYKRRLRANGVTIISVVENLDDSPESLMLESVIEGMAQYYSKNLAREVMKGQRESAYDCKHLGGIPPLGYDVDPKTQKYVINEAEANIVRLIFEKYLDGWGYKRLLDYLNNMGYKSKRGRCFGKNSLSSILTNEKYVGRYIFNKRQEKTIDGKRNPTLKPKEEWIVIEGGIPAIIEQSTFDAVQEKLSRNKRKSGSFKAKETYLLSGLIFCGECGEAMHGNKHLDGRKRSNYSSYRCHGRENKRGCKNKEIRRDYIDSFVLDELYKRLFSKISLQRLTEMLNEYNQKVSLETNSELAKAKTELSEVLRKVSSIIKMVTEAGISIDTVKADLIKLEEQKKYLESYIKELEAANRANSISEEQVREIIRKSSEFIRTHKVEECRNFIDSYIEKVIVYEDKVEIIFKVNVFDKETGTVSQLRSESTKDAVQASYYAEKGVKRSVIGRKRVGNGHIRTAVNL